MLRPGEGWGPLSVMWSNVVYVRPTWEKILVQLHLHFTSLFTHLACAVLKSSRTSANTDGGGCLMEDGAPGVPVAEASDAEVPVGVEVEAVPPS